MLRARLLTGLIVAAAGLPSAGLAAEMSIPMYRITDAGPGAPVGIIHAEDTPQGLQLRPELSDLPPGPHGFHVHENPSCEPAEKGGKTVAGLAAGGHWDPDNTGTHAGPMGQGHRGDLPVLVVAEDGTAKTPVIAPRLKVADLAGRSLIIHAGGDTYSDTPELGGGGPRIACGIAD